MQSVPHRRRARGICRGARRDRRSRRPRLELRGAPAARRALRAQDAWPGQTAIETYVRGELTSYSERTLRLYADFAARCKAEGVNLTKEIRDNIARSLGLSGSEEAEAILRRKYGLD